MAATVRILGIAGSLRKASYNRAALRAAQQLVPDGATLEIFDIEGIPGYNEELLGTPPQKVKELKEKVRAADAVLFVSPEYNYSVPGVLKNAIDWGSRPAADNCWADKPVAVMGVSTSATGTVRMQYHLRQMCVFLDMHPINKPEVMIGQAAQKFDVQLNLTDQPTRERIAALLTSLVAWTRRLSAGKPD
jgi:chromate reductase